MKKLFIGICLIGLMGCGSHLRGVRHYRINKTTSVVRCKTNLEVCRKEMLKYCNNPVEVDNGYGDKSGYWLLYSCYSCGR